MLVYVGRWPPTAKTCSCSELFGAMHWRGDAAENQGDRNKNHPLMSHSTELQVRREFPHPV